MSPVSTATRSLGGRASSVFSSNVVFPEPGELIRFKQSTLFPRNRSRRSAAMRSFSLRTFFSSGTRFIFLQLEISNFQLVSADAVVARAPTGRAAKIKVFHTEFRSTIQAAMTAWTELNLQL